jgi:metal-responsive CopG/Arc/MetJ family transcriptional regulator
MNVKTTQIHQRVNITLPAQTIQYLNELAVKGQRSQLINQAVIFYIQEMGRANLRKHLKHGVLHHRKRDLSLAKDWFALEQESWNKNTT